MNLDEKEKSENLVAAYQELLKRELEPYIKGRSSSEWEDSPIEIKNFFTDQDINDVCKEYNVQDCNELKSFLIDYGKYGIRGYHTFHFDLIYRIVNIRNIISQPPIPLEYSIEMDEEPVPDFNRWRLSEVITQEELLKALRETTFEGKEPTISTFQKEVILKIFNKEKEPRNHAIGIGIVAPTASGKTLSFLIPVLIKAIERVKGRKEGVSSLLVYPRKALERDQLKKILSIVDKLNEMGINVTVGIDDGDTRRRDKVEPNKPFRGLKCIRSKCDGNLVYAKDNKGEIMVKCDKCGKEYNYILATKEDIWAKKPTILISNIYTVYRRLMNRNTVNMYLSLDYVVFDEVHVYTDFLGGYVHYILKMLKYVSRQSNPIFIFSSATIPKPDAFLEKLFSQKVEVLDYFEIYKNFETKYKRLIIRLYLLPNPQRSIETLYQAVALVTTLWSHRFKQKVISFIDSIAEIATLEDYIKNTILGIRKGREVLDHLDVKDPLNNYSWITIAPDDVSEQFINTTFKRSIRSHYGRLDLSTRVKRESDFQEGRIRHLMSTSTLELGIDISDVAIVIQYKLPISPEGVIQRIGRAGRDPKSFRVALGIILLPSSPIGTLYMYDKDLRRRFADINANKPYGVGYDSDIIKLQAVFSLVLLKRALEGKETYIVEGKFKELTDIRDAIYEILDDLNNLDDFNSQVSLIAKHELESKRRELQSLLQNIADRINRHTNNKRSSSDIIDIGDIISIIDLHKRKINDILDRIYETENIIKYLKVDLNSAQNKFDYYEGEKVEKRDLITFLKHTLIRARDILESVRSEIESAASTSSNLDIDNWLKQKSRDIDSLMKNLNQLNIFNNKEIKKKIRKSKKEISDIAEEAEERLEEKEKIKKLKYTADTLDKILASVVDEITNDKENLLSQTIRFLTSNDNSSLNLITILHNLKNVNINAYYIDKKIRLLKKTKAFRKFNIFDVVNNLYNNKIKFSLMLDPPLPEIEMGEGE